MEEFKNLLNFYQEIGAGFLEMQAKPAEKREGLPEITREIMSCTRCPLHKSKKNYVPGEGSSNPHILFVGEGPGETEDNMGRPFVGKAGQLLDRLIERMGYSREKVFIGNIVKCRPPGNRDPEKNEVEACLPYLVRQIAAINPAVIVCLGRVALNNLLGKVFSITRERGKVFDFNGIPVIPTFHPSYILHQKSREAISRAKWDTWNDMQKVLEIVKKA